MPYQNFALLAHEKAMKKRGVMRMIVFNHEWFSLP
jgi:hypothetical protein